MAAPGLSRLWRASLANRDCAQLTDTCFKNGGDHFLKEVASREFMDNLISLLQASGPAAVNPEVRAKILEYIQAWASATEGRHDLSYIGQIYTRLQREGNQFPPRTTVSSSMIDSSAVRSSPQALRIGRDQDHADSFLVLAPRVGRLRRLYAMPNCLYLYEPETPLPQLRMLLRPAVLEQDAAPPPHRDHDARPGRRRMLHEAHEQDTQRRAGGSVPDIPPQDAEHVRDAAEERAGG